MSIFPNVEVGDLVTADLLNSMLPLAARMTANQSLTTSSIVLQNITELAVPVESDAIYFTYGWLRFTAGSNTPDIRLNYTYPSGASFTRADMGVPTTTTTQADVVDLGVYSTGDTSRGASTGQRSVFMQGELITGGTAGTFQVQAAQQTSSVDALTMIAGSRIMLVRFS